MFVFTLFFYAKKANISFIKVHLIKSIVNLNNTKYDCFINYNILKVIIFISVVM